MVEDQTQLQDQSAQGSSRAAQFTTSPRGISIVAGIVAVVIVAVFVILQGVGSLSSGGAGSASHPATFMEALQSASSTVASVSGGPWSLTSAVGVAYTVPWSLDAFRLSHQCTAISGTFQNATYPAGSGNYTGGQAGVWVLSFAGPAPSGGVLFVVVGYGSATEIGIVSASGSCRGYYGIPVGNVVDSSVAMEKVLVTTNGSRFAQMFPRSNATYFIGPEVPPVWTISLSPCADIVRGAGAVESTIWAVNGTIQSPPQAPTVC